MAIPSLLIDKADIIIGSSYGNVTSRRIKNYKVGDEKTREPFIPVGSDRPVGTTSKPGAQTIDLEVMPEQNPEVPYRKLHASGEVFTITIQERAGAQLGQRIQYQVQVSEVTGPDGDNAGEYTQSVKLIVIGEGRAL